MVCGTSRGRWLRQGRCAVVKTPLTFNPIVVTYWESTDGRFRIKSAFPKGFCAEDLRSYDSDVDRYTRYEFTDTYEEAVEWCKERAD